MTVILEPKESQDLYEFVLNNRSKLPPMYKAGDTTLTTQQLEEIYDIVATNRAKSRGTRLALEINDDGEVSKIEYEAVKIPPQEIITPKIKQCPHCDKQFENALPKCPKCGKENIR
jgi:hypothetical protein